jgi:hypothetical protein
MRYRSFSLSRGDAWEVAVVSTHSVHYCRNNRSVLAPCNFCAHAPTPPSANLCTRSPPASPMYISAVCTALPLPVPRAYSCCGPPHRPHGRRLDLWGLRRSAPPKFCTAVIGAAAATADRVSVGLASGLLTVMLTSGFCSVRLRCVPRMYHAPSSALDCKYLRHDKINLSLMSGLGLPSC